MSPLPYYDFNDYSLIIRTDGFKSKRYRHWCSLCKRDRGYAYKNKILKEPFCHSCKMKQLDVITKIRNNSKKLVHSEQSKLKISKSLFRSYRTTEINSRIARKLRSRFNKALKHSHKAGSAVRDLGCSIDFLKKYLESLFLPGMTWANYGRDGWHIDHVVPLCRFDLTNTVELKKACNYTNLQPMWAKDNLSKRKTDGTFKK